MISLWSSFSAASPQQKCHSISVFFSTPKSCFSTSIDYSTNFGNEIPCDNFNWECPLAASQSHFIHAFCNFIGHLAIAINYLPSGDFYFSAHSALLVYIFCRGILCLRATLQIASFDGLPFYSVWQYALCPVLLHELLLQLQNPVWHSPLPGATH